MLLADLGARTIKVEPPGTGEGTRRLLESDPEYSRDGMGAYYLTLNRNKQSVCIDLKSERGLGVCAAEGSCHAGLDPASISAPRGVG